MPLYELHNITQSYNGQSVLTIDHWTLDSHTVTGVVGPNGSGKSTLLAILGFVAAPTQGQIHFKGRLAEPFSEVVRGRVALLPQEAFLLKRSVFRNIAYGLQMNPTRDDLQQRVHEAMMLVGLDPHQFGRRPWYALSGGEVRRVALAARLALKPEVLLLDEPTASVDVTSAQMIKEAALHARDHWGTTLVITSHDAEWLADISDNTLHLFRGRILGNGHHSLIFGPWQQNGSKLVFKQLTEDQHFLAAGLPDDPQNAVAAIAAGKMTLHPASQPLPAGHHGLEGLLLRLNYEHSACRTSAVVLVGKTLLTTYLPPTQAPAFSPGQTVWIFYAPEVIEWY